MSSTRSKAFNVLYTSDVNKKRKVYHDGTLNLKHNAQLDQNVSASLFAEDKALLRRSTEKAKLFNDVSVGDEIVIGNFSVQIESILEENVNEEDSHANSSDISCIKNDQNIKSSSLKVGLSQSFRQPSTINHESKKLATGIRMVANKAEDTSEKTNISIAKFKAPSRANEQQDFRVSTSCSSLVVELDASLTAKMRQHQIDGANFLLNRLTEDRSESGSESLVQGAILADEVIL